MPACYQLNHKTLYLCLNFESTFFSIDLRAISFNQSNVTFWLTGQRKQKCNLFRLEISILSEDSCNNLCGRIMMSFSRQRMDGWMGRKSNRALKWFKPFAAKTIKCHDWFFLITALTFHQFKLVPWRWFLWMTLELQRLFSNGNTFLLTPTARLATKSRFQEKNNEEANCGWIDDCHNYSEINTKFARLL